MHALNARLPSVQSAEAVWLVTARVKERDRSNPRSNTSNGTASPELGTTMCPTVRYVLPVGCSSPRRLAAQGSSSWAATAVNVAGAIREALTAMMMPPLPMH